MDANSVVYMFGGGEFVQGSCQRWYLQQDWMFLLFLPLYIESQQLYGCAGPCLHRGSFLAGRNTASGWLWWLSAVP